MIQNLKKRNACIVSVPWISFHCTMTYWKYRVARSLHQTIVAAGGKCIEDNCEIISSLSYDQVQERDPITSLYPFAAVACGEDGDLERSFELLSRQPDVCLGWIEIVILDQENSVESFMSIWISS